MLPGWIEGDAPVIAIGGHYDSVPNAPGANDDGTGIATILELAYTLSKYQWPLDIYFCAFNSEEIGLIGSGEVANYFSSSGIQLLQYYNVDMLLVEDIDAPPDEKVLMAYNDEMGTIYQTSHYWADLTRMMSRNLGRDLILPVSSNSFSVWTRSDHYSFVTRGYPNVLFAFESGGSRDTAYHQPTDTWDNPLYNYTLAHETVACIGSSIGHTMSRSFGNPMEVSYSGVLETDSRRYYLANTIQTTMNLTISWNNGPITIDVYSPSDILLGHEDILGISGSNEDVLSIDLIEDGLHEIILSGDSEPEFSFSLEYESDIEGDDIPDSEQYWFDVELFEIDHDADGLSDAEEMILGTNKWLRDTDSDAMEDLFEIENGFDPLNATDGTEDEDKDGISNSNEIRNGTSIFSNDTDSDNMPDLYEILNQLDPLIDDSLLDADGDTIANFEEFKLGLNPQSNDTDLDLMPDAWELLYNLDPLSNDSLSDIDFDSLTNLYEYLIGTSPLSSDTDSDTMPDNYEVENGLNPTIDDTTGDLDLDTLSNLDEYSLGTNPQSNDSDFDLMPDAWEVFYSLDPLRNDSQSDPDHDGIVNLDEYLYGYNPRISNKSDIGIIGVMFAVGLVLIIIPSAIALKKFQ
jgi:hypothetical protein